MFLTWFERNAQQALDLDAVALLPRARAAGGRPPLRPAPEDEGRHEPGPEALWNESWYFDAVSRRRHARRVRAARPPAQPGRRALHRVRLRPGPPVGDARRRRPRRCPPPTTTSRRSRPPSFSAAQRCEEPLRALRGARCAARPRPTRTPSAPLRGEPGEPVEVELDLVWETDGIPYAWRASTRYEIPCRVSGTVRVGEETIELDGPRPARPLLGLARLVGDRLDVERAAPRGRHPHPRRRPARDARLRRRLRPARRASSRRSRRSPPSTSWAPAGLIAAAQHRLLAPAARARGASRSRSARCAWRRPTGGVAVPARDVPGARRRRPGGHRLGRVEPGAALGDRSGRRRHRRG